jgi:hypothetical protein
LSQHRHSAALVLVALSTVLVGACVQPPPPGVAVKPLKADLVFGIKPKDAAKPVAFEPPVAEDAQPQELVFPDQPDDLGAPSGPTRVHVPLLQAANPCPEAKLNAFPALEATRSVTTQPQAGVYRWKQGGSYVTTVGGTPYTINVGGFQQRVITNVTEPVSVPNPTSVDPDAKTTTFTYQLIQAAGGVTKRITYQVKTGAVGVRSTPGLQPGDTPLPTTPLGPLPTTTTTLPRLPEAVAAGDPERGLTIKSIEDLDPKTGEAAKTIDFSPAVQVLPLDVIPQEPFRSVGVDSKNQATLVHDGVVRDRTRIDACGDIVDGWQVDITAHYAEGGTTQDVNQTFIFATQYGGMPILETDDFGDGGKVTYSLGQLVPSPLPAG